MTKGLPMPHCKYCKEEACDCECNHGLPSWMPANPFRKEPMLGIDVALATGFDAGVKIAQAKLRAYLFETCPHNDIDLGGEGVTMCYRHACGQCMVELKEVNDG